MKTEVRRTYQSGFLLSEQELRRIVQACHEHADKIGASARSRLVAKLKSGAVVETEHPDEILALENSGQKQITSVEMRFDDGAERPQAQISVEFQDGLLSAKNWTSIATEVAGPSRDAVFVAAADLEDRINKTRMRSWPYIVSRPWFFVFPMLVALILVSFMGEMVTNDRRAINALEAEYKAGHFSNPIEALIFFEREKTHGSTLQRLAVPAAAFGIPFLIFGLATVVAPKVSLSYVFYWSDAVARYDKRRNVGRIFWTVVVLGIAASVIGGLVLRFI